MGSLLQAIGKMRATFLCLFALQLAFAVMAMPRARAQDASAEGDQEPKKCATVAPCRLPGTPYSKVNGVSQLLCCEGYICCPNAYNSCKTQCFWGSFEGVCRMHITVAGRRINLMI